MKNLVLQRNGNIDDIITTLNSFNKQGFKVEVIHLSVGINTLCVFNLRATTPTLRTKLDDIYLIETTKGEGTLL